MKPRAGFEPATSALPSLAHNGESLFDVDWDAFRDWLSNQGYKPKTARERFNYAKRFAYCLLEQNLRDLKVLSGSGQAFSCI